MEEGDLREAKKKDYFLPSDRKKAGSKITTSGLRKGVHDPKFSI
jgi:hypothetical protein